MIKSYNSMIRGKTYLYSISELKETALFTNVTLEKSPLRQTVGYIKKDGYVYCLQCDKSISFESRYQIAKCINCERELTPLFGRKLEVDNTHEFYNKIDYSRYTKSGDRDKIPGAVIVVPIAYYRAIDKVIERSNMDVCYYSADGGFLNLKCSCCNNIVTIPSEYAPPVCRNSGKPLVMTYIPANSDSIDEMKEFYYYFSGFDIEEPERLGGSL